ncbi:peroxidase [Eurytemora carolleeae]|uniref:peroxidase n=1 Tax=Eurytemora carolleeae TaxID=1294199 RepID=UPI000C78BFD7|nr:peroxidase [Eurytemora carolleeae]|eukprot:XP_023331177.1 peroxidase-like [Eurytemora affinis]
MKAKSIFLFSFLLFDASILGERTRRQACTCKPFSQCVGQYRDLGLFDSKKCSLEEGKTGVCCPDVQQANRKPNLSLREDDSNTRLRVPSGVNTASVRAEISKIPRSPIFSDGSKQGDQDVKAFRLINQVRPSDQAIYDAALKLSRLNDVDGVTLSLRADDEGLDSTNSVDIDGLCPWTQNKPAGRKPNCPRTVGREYRTIDGSCNNIRSPIYGMASTPFQRIVAPEYSPGLQPRKNSRGEELPGARSVTTTIFSTGDPPNQFQISELFVQFGQFLDHEFAHTPVVAVDCCDKNSQGFHWNFPSTPRHPDCVPIRVPSNDSFWGPRGRECIELSRNLFSPTLKCKAGQREQINSLTHWIDLSNTYGSTEEEFEDVRDPQDRRLLLVSRTSTGESLPPSCPGSRRERPMGCEEVCAEPSRNCVFSGDFRASEQPGLTVEHLTWIREHNRLAEELSSINPSWPQEKVFQESRRINIAEWQHIIYNEWLPLALGPEYMQVFGLLPLSPGSPLLTDYDPSMDPRVTNEFAAAAFRFGHTMVKSTLGQVSDRGRNTNSVDLKTVFNNANNIRQSGFVENSLRGATRNSAAERDQVFTDDLVNHLFEDQGAGGLDLMSINIQRGRERGVPGYNRYRQECASGSFKSVRNIDELANDGYISAEEVRRLKLLYEDVNDIDLFVGGVLEEPHRNSLLGPTFKCIVGDQFLRLKRGDRFFYENEHKDGFSFEQVNELRKVSLARIICDNFKIAEIQPLVFRTNAGANSLVDCKDAVSIPRVNLDLFRE